MKAPDKIYVNIPGDYWHTVGSEKTVNDIEYIRKDALLEWAKEQMAQYPHAHNGIGLGQWDTFRKVIEKIESL